MSNDILSLVVFLMAFGPWIVLAGAEYRRFVERKYRR